MIRVLHAITKLALGSAAENTLRQLVSLQGAGYAVALAVGLAASDPRFVARGRQWGCRLLDVPALDRDPAPRRDLLAVARLVRLIRRERPAIVHTHTSKAGFLGRLAARLARAPAVIHQPHGHIFYGYYGPARTRFYVALERIAARWSDRIVALTEAEIHEHLALGIGRREQFVTVPSGVPTAELRARAPGRDTARRMLGIDDETFVVAAIGRLVPIKGFDILLRALPTVVASLPRTRALVVGDGPEMEALAALARSLGVADHVRMDGASAEVETILSAADVLAAPSRNEGMGRVLVEAMALGVPVIGAAVGGIPDVIGNGLGGGLVPPDDPAALAAALIEIGGDPGRRLKLAEAARERAEAFSTTVAEARLLELYATLVRDKGLA